MKKYLLIIAATIVLPGCVCTPPGQTCPVPPAPVAGFFYGSPCTAYHPNYFYRCNNNRCVTYSPYAPNKCDPVPYYTNCKYTSCCQANYTEYF